MTTRETGEILPLLGEGRGQRSRNQRQISSPVAGAWSDDHQLSSLDPQRVTCDGGEAVRRLARDTASVRAAFVRGRAVTVPGARGDARSLEHGQGAGVGTEPGLALGPPRKARVLALKHTHTRRTVNTQLQLFIWKNKLSGKSYEHQLFVSSSDFLKQTHKLRCIFPSPL